MVKRIGGGPVGAGRDLGSPLSPAKLISNGPSLDGYVPSDSSELGTRFAAFGLAGHRSTVASATRTAEGTGTAWQPSKYWAAPEKEMDVDIDGHDFDFKPDPGPRKEKMSGTADGPFSHNGRYDILESSPDRFRMKLHVGSDREQRGDLDVDLRIAGDVATIKGSVNGEPLPAEGVKARVTGAGTKSSPYRLSFSDAEGKARVITWRPE